MNRLGWILLLLGCLAPGAQAQEPLRSYFGSAPQLDGVLSPGEWDDATAFHGAKDWLAAFHPVTSDEDLSITAYIKHDNEFIYFAADVTDDVLYGIDTERWLPESNPKAHELSREGYPWLGDEMEILLSAADPPPDRSVQGNGSSWQMVCNLTKSRPGGVGVGGILEGEPRKELSAWETYQKWIEHGAQKCTAQKKPEGKGYVLEWAIRFDPCVEMEAGKFYAPDMGKKEVRVKFVLGDLDSKEAGAGNRFYFHHEQWLAPGADDDAGGRWPWGRLLLMGKESRPAASR